MQSVSAKIWTRIAVSISNDDNHYTTVFFPLRHESTPDIFSSTPSDRTTEINIQFKELITENWVR